MSDRLTLPAILSTSLCAACLNVAAGFGREHLGPAEPALLLQIFSGSVAVVLVGLTILAAALYPLIRASGDRGDALLLACCAFVTVASAAVPLTDWRPWFEPVAFTFAALAAVSISILVYVLMARRMAVAGRVLLSAPCVTGLTAVLVWTLVYGLTEAALFEVSAALLVYALAVALTLAATFRIGSRIRPLPLLGTAVALALAAGPSAALVGGRMAVPPADSGLRSKDLPERVFLVTVDTLRADALGALGGDAATETPRLDELATESIVFTQARSAAPWTKPAFASIFTGTSPLVHQAISRRSVLPTELTTLAELMRDEGYLTAAVQSNPNLAPEFNFAQGFSVYHSFPKPTLGRSFGARLLRRAGYRSLVSTDQLTDLAIDWIDSRTGLPFFLWLHYQDPHFPYTPPLRFLKGRTPVASIGLGFKDFEGVRGGGRILSRDEREWIRELYEAEVRYVDENVGRLLDHLRRRGIYDDSLIVFTSDHGEEFWEHGGFEHGHSFYDEVLRVPLMIKLPAGVGARRVATPVSTTSIYSTLIAQLGLPSDGRLPPTEPLSRFWADDGSEAAARPSFSTGALYFEEGVALVFENLKYLRRLGLDREQLFLLDEDAAERRPVESSCIECLEKARRLLQEIASEDSEARRRLGLLAPPERDPGPALREQLRSLGYLN